MKKLIGILLLFSSTIFAREINLQEAIDLALNNSKTLEQSSRNTEIGELNLSRAFKSALPTVAYQGIYSKYEHTLTNVYLAEDLQTRKSKDYYTSQIIVTYPIFQGGAVLGGIKGAKAQSNVLKYSYLKEKANTRINVIDMYSEILTKEKNLEALETSRLQLSSKYKEQEEKLKMELIIKADLLKTQYSLLNVESEIVKTKNEIYIGKKKLKIETGINDLEEITLEKISVPTNLSDNINLDEDMKLAKTSSLDALISENNLKYKKAEEMVAFSDNLPKVNVFGEYGGTKMKHFSETDDNQEWRGGVQIDWEFFSFGSGIDKYRVAKENYKIQELEDSIVQDNIEINLTTAYSEVIRLEKLRKANKSSLEASRENYNIDKERYDAGLISTQDFLDSEVQYREAKINYNQAESDYLIAFEKYRTLLI
ncbi:TolC family protein [Fusobacterium sp. IOR10]|uniref:TolC family protein n=1 Tax=Fusobacterium sp. IOR10 TaxID=2665157 RepID=UPI0013D0E3BC|nr:TolC family protein [Fusobacterium sp. IOR10]